MMPKVSEMHIMYIFIGINAVPYDSLYLYNIHILHVYMELLYSIASLMIIIYSLYIHLQKYATVLKHSHKTQINYSINSKY